MKKNTETTADNSHIGSSLEDLLREEGILAEVHAKAVKRVLDYLDNNPNSIQPITTDLLSRIKDLVGDEDIDINEPLPDDPSN